ncbi:MAG: hypothetical protein ACI92S_005655 [Planctomycetaceae bacterium]|jgi:hypothetical protein
MPYRTMHQIAFAPPPIFLPFAYVRPEWLTDIAKILQCPPGATFSDWRLQMPARHSCVSVA